MKLEELIHLLQYILEKEGNLVIGYDGGVMTFSGSWSIEERWICRDETQPVISLEGELT